jgi:hypothetical protein
MLRNISVPYLQSDIIEDDRISRSYIETNEDQLLTLSEFSAIDKHTFKRLVEITGSVVVPPNHPFIKTEEFKTEEFKTEGCKEDIPLLKEDYISNILVIMPCVLEILSTNCNLVLGGGGALYPLMKIHDYKIDSPSDWDLFYYGDATTDDIIIIENTVYDILQKYYENFDIVKCKGITQITTKDCKIQIIFKDYVSISEILHSFDISASKIAFDGREVYLTKSFAWAFITKLIIVSPEYRSNTYEIRLKKYSKNKTFGLIFKNVQIDSNEQKTIKLPFCDIIIQDFISPNLVIGYIKLEDIEVIEYTNIQNRYSGIGALDNLSKSKIFDINAELFCLSKYEYFIYKETFISNKANMEHLSISNITSLNAISITHILKSREFELWLHMKLITLIVLNREYIYELNNNTFDMLFYQYSDKAILKQQILDLILKTNNRISGEFFPKTNTFALSLNFRESLMKIVTYIYDQNSNVTIDWCSYIDRTYSDIDKTYADANKDKMYADADIDKTYADANKDKTAEEFRSTMVKKTDKEWNGDKYYHHEFSVKFIDIKYSIIQFIQNYPMDRCAICFDKIHQYQENIIRLSCGHIFHENKIINITAMNVVIEPETILTETILTETIETETIETETIVPETVLIYDALPYTIICGGITTWLYQKNECAICRSIYCSPCVEYF